MSMPGARASSATTDRCGASSWCRAASLADRTMREAMATASDEGSRAAWSSDMAMTRTLPSAASARRLACVDESGGRTSTISCGDTDSATLSMTRPSTSCVTSWMASATQTAGDDQPGRAVGVLDALAEQLHVVVREEVGVVDQHVCRRHRRVRGERSEVATHAQDVGVPRPGAPATTCRSRAGPPTARPRERPARSAVRAARYGVGAYGCTTSLLTRPWCPGSGCGRSVSAAWRDERPR